MIKIQTINKPHKNSTTFTHVFLNNKGWDESVIIEKWKEEEIIKIIYLGKCALDGDMFALYKDNGNIFILKGHLNSGEYFTNQE